MYAIELFIANHLLPLLTLLGQIIIIATLLGWLLLRKNNRYQLLIGRFSKYALTAAFIVSLMATLGSLFYSEILHYQPCKLCWFQRIFMYPQVILLGIAAWKHDYCIKKYSLTLSLIGLLIAAYHYLMQIGLIIAINCGVVGYSASCNETFVLQYGYITIPMMSLTAFGLISLLMIQLKDLKSPNLNNQLQHRLAGRPASDF